MWAARPRRRNSGPGVEPAGPPIWRYRLIDMARELLVDVGVPVATAVSGNGRIVGGVLPAGKYVTVTTSGIRTNWPASPANCGTGPRAAAWRGT